MNNYPFSDSHQTEIWQNIETPFEVDIACLAITKRGNVLVKTIEGEVWLSNKIKLDRWHKIKDKIDGTLYPVEILYSVGDKPKLW